MNQGTEIGESLALARIAQGDRAGWQDFSSRWRARHAYLADGRAWWDGEADADRAVCVLTYGGVGDSLLFARYLPQVEERVGQLMLWVPPVLQRLLRTALRAEPNWPARIDDIPREAALCCTWDQPHLLGPPA